MIFKTYIETINTLKLYVWKKNGPHHDVVNDHQRLTLIKACINISNNDSFFFVLIMCKSVLLLVCVIIINLCCLVLLFCSNNHLTWLSTYTYRIKDFFCFWTWLCHGKISDEPFVFLSASKTNSPLFFYWLLWKNENNYYIKENNKRTT